MFLDILIDIYSISVLLARNSKFFVTGFCGFKIKVSGYQLLVIQDWMLRRTEKKEVSWILEILFIIQPYLEPRRSCTLKNHLMDITNFETKKVENSFKKAGKRNWHFTTNSNVLIPKSLQTGGVKLRHLIEYVI